MVEKIDKDILNSVNSYLRVLQAHKLTFESVWLFGSAAHNTSDEHSDIDLAVIMPDVDNKFYKDNVAVPYQNPTDKRIQGRIAAGHLGRMPYSWFYFDLVKNVSKDKTFHSCQIPLKLVEMLIKSCTKEGDDVFILFGGSGSELFTCKDLKRNYISCELHPDYYKMIIDRLNNNGKIKDEFRLDFIQQKNGQPLPIELNLFSGQYEAQRHNKG